MKNRYPYDQLDECCRSVRNTFEICTWIAATQISDRNEEVQFIADMYGRIRVRPSDTREDVLVIWCEGSKVMAELDMHSMILNRNPLQIAVIIFGDLYKREKYIRGY